MVSKNQKNLQARKQTSTMKLRHHRRWQVGKQKTVPNLKKRKEKKKSPNISKIYYDPQNHTVELPGPKTKH